jgi:phage-related protein
MATLPIGVTGPMSSSGGCAPVSLFEIQTVTGNTYYFSEQRGEWNSIINGTTGNLYEDWIVGTPKFQLHGSTETDTAAFSVQNLSGNTVQRDMALAYSRNEFIGAFVYYRLWRADAEQAIFSFMGNIVDADIDESTIDFSIEGFGNFSNIVAPAYLIDVSCPLYFGSIACGSTSPTPCNQSYGDCSSIERFAGVVLQWDYTNEIQPLVQISQPAPGINYNPARPF